MLFGTIGGRIENTGSYKESPVKEIIELLKRHSLVCGLVLMFALTWPIDLANAGVMPLQVPFAVYVLFGWGLSIAALIMTGLTEGRHAVIALLKRFLIWRVSWNWYLVAFLLYPIIFSSAVVLNALWTNTPIDFSTVMAHKIFGASATLSVFIVPFFVFDTLTNGEELAWRGYVLPRLQAKHGALIASLVLGVIWGFWHLPRYLAPGSTGPFGWFMLKALADAILYTWLYNNTRGSLLLVTILHAAGNTAGVFLPMANTLSSENLGTLLIAIALEILVAVIVTVYAGPAWLSRTEPKQVYLASWEAQSQSELASGASKVA